jgi:hypothetical protein
MKKLYPIILLMSFVYANAQSIQLLYNDEVVNTDTITVYVNETVHEYYLDLVNTSTKDINLMITRNVISLLPGADTYFCFDNCYNSNVDQLPSAITFLAGDTFSHHDTDPTKPYFYAAYYPEGQKGISLVKFNFFDEVNPTDVKSVVFKFNSTDLGITNNQEATLTLKAYPNPATTKVFIQHDLKKQTSEARIRVTNLMGAVLKTIPVNPTSDRTQIDVSGFVPGIYFYSLEVNGKVSVTKKLIVK